ncbi:MAG: GntR family transcriptional regulator [Rubrimonas sp.]
MDDARPEDAPLIEVERKTIATQIFERLLERIITLDLAPGAKISEVEIARAMDVSRQPVREAFFRLSQAGLLVVRPQRATTVAPISEREVYQAQFVRLALETAIIRRAAAVLTDADLAALEALIERQKIAMDAGERLKFHGLDDEMHRQIAERAGCGFAWGMIREQKMMMDRVRFLSLAEGSATAWGEHVRILAALRARDAEAAASRLTEHLSRIETIVRRIRDEHEEYFTPERAGLIRVTG